MLGLIAGLFFDTLCIILMYISPVKLNASDEVSYLTLSVFGSIFFGAMVFILKYNSLFGITL